MLRSSFSFGIPCVHDDELTVFQFSARDFCLDFYMDEI